MALRRAKITEPMSMSKATVKAAKVTAGESARDPLAPGQFRVTEKRHGTIL
jgi:hypothetical protein